MSVSGYKRLKLVLYDIIETGERFKRLHSIISSFILALILLNLFAIILESFNNLKSSFGLYFNILETVSMVVFTIEYSIRFITADIKYCKKAFFAPKLKFSLSFMGIIDLLAILPGYLDLLSMNPWLDLRFLRILRLTRLTRVFRVLRVLKLNRYSNSMTLVAKVFKNKKDELIVSVLMMLLLLLVSSVLMYEVEHVAQADKFTNVFSSVWWAIATLTTVGYGDIFPITPLGKFLSGIIAIIGIGLVALPTGIISSGFLEELNNRKEQQKQEQESEEDPPCYCPYCGKKIKH